MPTVAAEQAVAQPPERRGRKLLDLREDQWFDRKSNRIKPPELANAMIGFANAEGGIIVVGLWNGKVEGVDARATSLSTWQQAAMDYSIPPVPATSRLVECVNDRGERDHLLVIEVETSALVHWNQRDEVFLRVGDENRRLSFHQRQELQYDKGQATYESTVVEGASRRDLDNDLLQSYADALKHPNPGRLLKARGLLTREDRVTVAAALLFAEHPQQWLPEAYIRVLRYQGTERGTGARQQLLSDERFDGPIPQQLLNARQVIFERIPTRQALGSGGRFDRIGLIPGDAWLEGLVNAAIHRSYSMSGDHIRVEIFDDRVEVESPGRFPGIADARDPLKVTRFARNPRIARVCADLSFGQELGEGIRRMFEEMRLAGLADPQYVQTAGSVRVTLLSTPVDRALEARLPRGSREVLRAIREAGRASTGDITEVTGRSRPSVRAQLRALETAGLIQWNGHSPKDPRAYWTVKVG
ncbi:MAG TPA: ATP-binding protein [Acidimicrobiales bacterium]|nr:ATP-binding protein [Acidimicrobiales bacterium]